MKIEDELAAALKQEIIKELANENGLTPESMQSKIDNEQIAHLRKVAEYLDSRSPPVDGVYQIKFVQRIPNYVDGALPYIVECNTEEELFRHTVFADFYHDFVEGFDRFEIADDGYVFVHYNNEGTPRWCCGHLVRRDGKELH